MEYTGIHIYGNFLSDDILRSVKQDTNFIGNRDQDFALGYSVQKAIDNAWSSLRNDWHIYKERNLVNDQYGTRRSRDLMERFFISLEYDLVRQTGNIMVNGVSHEITYLCPSLKDLPIVVVGDKTGDAAIDTLEKCTLDFRAKGAMRKKSPHATMLDYLNSTENVYGIISNGRILRLIRNTGQLVKLTYIEFNLQRILEEDKYTEFCLMFRLLHATRFQVSGDENSIMEKYFNMSIQSGNRIRNGLSLAVQNAMVAIGNAALCSEGTGNDALRSAIVTGELPADDFNKELIHFIYRLLFLFIIEERDLVYQIPPQDSADYDRVCRCQEIYKRFYAASHLRHKSEMPYLYQSNYCDMWSGLIETFSLFENEGFGNPLGIRPLGGILFDAETLHYLKRCTISNKSLLEAFRYLNEFKDVNQQRVKINYGSLDVEEFGSVYEGILEKKPFIKNGSALADWEFSYIGGLDRQSTSSYYTRPDLVQNLIRTTLVPVIENTMKRNTTREDKIRALLDMKLCDAASGSGHIVLAMARTVAWYVSCLRTGEDNPASLDYRQALCEVIQKCIYAVDCNPDAVELCKVVLWIEGYSAGKPLSYLDHHIRCGNSVLGVTSLEMLLKGVPNEAFSADSTAVRNTIKAINKQAVNELRGESDGDLLGSNYRIDRIKCEHFVLAHAVRDITALPENSLLDEQTKKLRWMGLMASHRMMCLRRACDIYTYAFYHQFIDSDVEGDFEGTTYTLPDIPYTKTVFQALGELNSDDDDFAPLSAEFKAHVAGIAKQHKFFHWCVEFPEVFAEHGGFDVMCGNPPWDKLQMEDEKWFSGKDEDIVRAPNQSARNKLIASLQLTNPALFQEYQNARNDIANLSKFVKCSGRFTLSASGKIDLYPLFAEHCMNCAKEAWGLVMPTGIAVNDSTKDFFGKLVEENRLISLYDFENKEALFDIHRMFKFCLLTAGKPQETPRTVSGGFFLTRLDHLLDPNRIYTLQSSDFSLFNPNTKTCSIFRTSYDAELTTKIYRRCGILVNEVTGSNPWNVTMTSMFNMSTDSHLFRTYEQLTAAGGVYNDFNGRFLLNGQTYVPLYEGKMIWYYNHHYSNWPTEGARPNSIPNATPEELSDPNTPIVPWYWVPLSEVHEKFVKRNRQGDVTWSWNHKWLLGFRDVTNATNERTFIFSTIPDSFGVGNSTTLLFAECGTMPALLLVGMLSSLVFDYIAKQKIGGSHASITFVQQFPVLSPEQIPEEYVMQIVSRVAELCYFNHDLDGWAEELWDELTPEQQEMLPNLGMLEPYPYDPERRAVLQAELDAIFAKLYSLSIDDLRYILDPEDICGEGCINETFRVLKDREIRELSEYRTKRLVLEAWERFER